MIVCERIVGILVVIGCLSAGAHGVTCSSFTPDRDLIYPCGSFYNVNQNLCGTGQYNLPNGRSCCYRQGRGCMANSRGSSIGLNDLRKFGDEVYVPSQPDGSAIPGFVRSIPSASDPRVQRSLGRVNTNFQQNAFRRTIGLGLLLGQGKIANIFPRCPVHVKLCYRVPCRGFNNRDLDDNPNECLSDPTCCYDYELALLKRIFGPYTMGGAPTCYYGPTSQQWRFITSYFTPWNTFYSEFILEAFKSVFNTKLFNIGGQVLCSFDIQVKNYPVGSRSELECNLVSGCWDSSRPQGKQCTLANSFIKNIFGGFISDEAIYPSLFTDDYDDTKCASNWLDYGPKAYRRMECDVKDEPDDFVKKITDWCPYRDCCLNYAAFSASQIAQLSLIGSIGGGGFPIGGGILGNLGGLPSIGASGSIFGNAFGSGGQLSTLSNTNLLYLLSASSSSSSLNLEKLFCPYKNIFAVFIDLTESTEGCCKIPRCYHKKQYIGGSPQPTPPPSFIPPISYPGNWGQWGPCNAACGQQGSRIRTCYVNGRATSQSSCSGSESQVCSGSQCQVYYTWNQWQSGACSENCGPGTAIRTRTCRSNTGQQVPSNYCPGLNRENAACNNGPCVSYQWGDWTRSECNAACGGGTFTYSRSCKNSFGQTVSSSFCPGGASSGTASGTCNVAPCSTPGPSYSWTTWSTSACSATCGPGTLTYSRQCTNNFGQVVSPNFCQGQATITSSCDQGICPPSVSYRWSDRYFATSRCSRNCGSGYQTYSKFCTNAQTGQYVSNYLCGSNRPRTTRICFIRRCRFAGF